MGNKAKKKAVPLFFIKEIQKDCEKPQLSNVLRVNAFIGMKYLDFGYCISKYIGKLYII